MLNNLKKWFVGSEIEPTSTNEQAILKSEEICNETELDKLNHKIYIDVACNLSFFLDEETNTIYYSSDESYRDSKASLYKLDGGNKILTVTYRFGDIESDAICSVYYENDYSEFNYEKLKVINSKDEIIKLYKSIDDIVVKHKFKNSIKSKIVFEPTSLFDNSNHYFETYILMNDKYAIRRYIDYDNMYSDRNYENYKFEFYDLENKKYHSDIYDLSFFIYIDEIETDISEIPKDYFDELTYKINFKNKIEIINKDNSNYIEWTDGILDQHFLINQFLKENNMFQLMPIDDIDTLMKFLSIMGRYSFIKGFEFYSYEIFKENDEFLYVAETYLKNIKGDKK